MLLRKSSEVRQSKYEAADALHMSYGGRSGFMLQLLNKNTSDEVFFQVFGQSREDAASAAETESEI